MMLPAIAIRQVHRSECPRRRELPQVVAVGQDHGLLPFHPARRIIVRGLLRRMVVILLPEVHARLAGDVADRSRGDFIGIEMAVVKVIPDKEAALRRQLDTAVQAFHHLPAGTVQQVHQGDVPLVVVVPGGGNPVARIVLRQRPRAHSAIRQGDALEIRGRQRDDAQRRPVQVDNGTIGLGFDPIRLQFGLRRGNLHVVHPDVQARLFEIHQRGIVRRQAGSHAQDDPVAIRRKQRRCVLVHGPSFRKAFRIALRDDFAGFPAFEQKQGAMLVTAFRRVDGSQHHQFVAGLAEHRIAIEFLPLGDDRLFTGARIVQDHRILRQGVLRVLLRGIGHHLSVTGEQVVLYVEQGIRRQCNRVRHHHRLERLLSFFIRGLIGHVRLGVVSGRKRVQRRQLLHRERFQVQDTERILRHVLFLFLGDLRLPGSGERSLDAEIGEIAVRRNGDAGAAGDADFTILMGFTTLAHGFDGPAHHQGAVAFLRQDFIR